MKKGAGLLMVVSLAAWSGAALADCVSDGTCIRQAQATQPQVQYGPNGQPYSQINRYGPQLPIQYGPNGMPYSQINRYGPQLPITDPAQAAQQRALQQPPQQPAAQPQPAAQGQVQYGPNGMPYSQINRYGPQLPIQNQAPSPQGGTGQAQAASAPLNLGAPAPQPAKPPAAAPKSAPAPTGCAPGSPLANTRACR